MHVVVCANDEDVDLVMAVKCSSSLCSSPKHKLYCQIHAFLLRRGLQLKDHRRQQHHNVIDAAAFRRQNHHAVIIYLIHALSRQTPSAKYAILLCNDLQLVAGRPDTYTHTNTRPIALKALLHLSPTQRIGRQIHCHAVLTGLECDLHVATALIQMYASCRRVGDARELFDKMRFRGVASWNAIIAGYAKAGDVDTARALLERMPGTQRNVISWTSVIAGYAQAGRPNDAIFVFRIMQVEGVQPDEVALLAVLSACACLGALELGEWIHSCIEKHGLNKTVPLNNALVHMYAKSGNIGKAIEVFENMECKSVVTWTTIISGLALHGLGREALKMFTRMETAQVKPNDVTFIAILSACSHIGSVETGRWYFNTMDSRYGIKPKIQHYGCMIDLLGRSGRLQEALELIKRMPFEPNGAIWGSLLAASRIHGDVELAKRSLQHLIMVEPHNSGNYTLLSNVYAALGRWKESGIIRKLMRDTGLVKVPGESSIEVNNIVHEFITEDRSHPHSESIYKVLYQIMEQLKVIECMHDERWGLDEFEDGCSISQLY